MTTPNSNIFGGGNKPPANNLFSNTTNTNTQQVAGLFANKSAQGTNGGLFGGNPPQPQPGQQQGANIFNQSQQPPANQTKPNLFAGQQTTQTPNPNQPATTTQAGGLFGNKNTGSTGNTGGLFGNNANNQPNQSNESKLPTFGGNQNQNAQGQGAQSQSATQQAPQFTQPPQIPQAPNQPATNLFGGNQPASNPTTGQTGGIFGNKPATTGGIFNNTTTTSNTTTLQPNTSNAPSSNAPTNQPSQTASNPPSNTTAQQPTTNPPAGNLFGNQKPAQTTTATSQPASNGLFSNKPGTTGQQNPPVQGQPAQNQPTQNPPAQNTPTTGQQGSTGTGVNLFNNAASQPAQNQGQSGNTSNPTGPTFGNQTNPQGSNPVGQPSQSQPQPQRPTIQVQFDRNCHRPLKQFIEENRSQMQKMYEQLLKYSNSLIKFNQNRDQNNRIYDCFENLKPELKNSANLNDRILEFIEKTQAKVQMNLRLIEEDIGSDRTEHPLNDSLNECQKLIQQVIGLKKQEQNLNDYNNLSNQTSNLSQQQLMLLYNNILNIENQVQNLTSLMEITFGPNNSTNLGYAYDSMFYSRH